MKNVKERKSIKKFEFNNELWSTPREASHKNLRIIDTDLLRGPSGIKTYRKSKNDNLRISNSPSFGKNKPATPNGLPRKKSESSELMKASGSSIIISSTEDSRWSRG